jgi:signal transduction histidine kinase
MPLLNFTVDSMLLQELGERLVGKPYIALAELIKNGYDADTLKVTIEFEPKKDRITVDDNGHGMDLNEFTDFWMRIGSTHKKKKRVSKHFERPMTGSKGIGRLAVQFLAKNLELQTTSDTDTITRLVAKVNWDEAVKAGNLTDATVEYKTEEGAFEPGTKIILTGLKHVWAEELVEGLAREIWALQPPFRTRFTGKLSKESRKALEKAVLEKRKFSETEKRELRNAFTIQFKSPEKNYEEIFNDQISAILDIWHAKLVGKNLNGEVSATLEFNGKEPVPLNYTIPKCRLRDGDFEVRVYHLEHRQPRNIKVGDAREYLQKFGGVRVYDGGFHLPYYGEPTNDWLEIEQAHAHRLSKSQLLPQELQLEEGLTFLPSTSRLIGVVNVDTSRETELEILVTRDRLRESTALDNLRDMVRYALDFYAMREKARQLRLAELNAEIEKPKVQEVHEVLERYRKEIPEKTFSRFEKDLEQTISRIESDAEQAAKQVGMIGSLATIGISSLANQHEINRQFRVIDDIIEDMRKLEAGISNVKMRNTLKELRQELLGWIQRARATNALFSYFGDADNVRTRRRFLARRVLEEVKGQITSLERGIPIDIGRIDETLLLPEASLVEWSAVFQNVLINAFNAMMDSRKKLVDIGSRRKGKDREILVQDTGCGVNLKQAESLFEPFQRAVKISAERRALGYGGMGLGLTIVRLIARNIGCKVAFVEPEKGFSTAFSLRWRET